MNKREKHSNESNATTEKMAGIEKAVIELLRNVSSQGVENAEIVFKHIRKLTSQGENLESTAIKDTISQIQQEIRDRKKGFE